MPIRQEGFNPLHLMQDVAILDVRGSVRTKLQSTNAQGCRLEMSEYFADYDTYLEGHIPGEHLSKSGATLILHCIVRIPFKAAVSRTTYCYSMTLIGCCHANLRVVSATCKCRQLC